MSDAQAPRHAAGRRATSRGRLAGQLAREVHGDLSRPDDRRGVSIPRLAPTIETTAYFVVAEALTNVVKHAEASYARVTAAMHRDAVDIAVTDDGVGGADSAGGSGLMGLRDRVAAREGTFELHSPPGEGTALRVRLPVS